MSATAVELSGTPQKLVAAPVWRPEVPLVETATHYRRAQGHVGKPDVETNCRRRAKGTAAQCPAQSQTPAADSRDR